VNSHALTEKQQEVLWLRYGRRASIAQIATWLNISRRAVLARLRNARKRTAQNEQGFAEPGISLAAQQRLRPVSGSQVTSMEASRRVQLDDL
jgi:DNA-binding CsgD family transcriptional regulator